ncbi:acyl carrier protein [Micromonospora sp. FIMYZ51]|uniref:acyl carrier protein n=1 Tax=Micromonospora sp. FIMYZ51 TaxID=3051832 RepID=UPI00311E5A48
MTRPTCAQEEILGHIVEILAEELAVPAESVVPGAHVFDDLGLESLDLLTLIAILEERLGITVLDEEIGHMATVQGAVDVVAGKLTP